MTGPVKKIAVILILIILLPSLFFFYYEFSRLNENEEIIEKIYNNQLDAILFSVNQYSEDVVTSWASRIDNINDQNKNDYEFRKELNPFFNEANSIKYIFISSNDTLNIYPSPVFNETPDRLNIHKTVRQNSSLINRLKGFKKEEYRKLEPVQNSFLSRSSLLLFILKNNQVCGIVINPDKYIHQTLSPKIQGVAQNEFIISVIDSAENNSVYSTENINLNDIQSKKSLWLIPNYSLGIALKGQTIQQLAEERSSTNLILISALIFILMFAVWLVFRNVKKEIELAQIKSDFVSNVSHELRTPLALISMFAETLELGRAKNEEKKKEYYTIISQESNRLGRIVNKILNFSKMEAGKGNYHFESTNINEVVENIFNTYRFHLQNNGFNFSINKTDELPNINADSEAISEAVINLIDNAAKYSDNEKEIILATGKENNKIFIEVKDKGIGIPEEDQKKIFDKFFRVSTGLVHNIKGTGLGLTLVKHIMDAHKGEIKLKSSPGRGSSFILEFPINKSNNN